MQIDIRHIAKLSCLRLDEQETERFARQMAGIIEMVSSLPAIGGASFGLDPDDPMLLRPDVVEPSTARDELLRGAPQVEAGCCVVPRIVE